MASAKSKAAEKSEQNAREKALTTTLSSLHKRFGDGVIMKLGEATRLNVESIPTGSLSLDIALGVGGVPKGRILEIYGPESSGKTTVCLHIIAEAQRKGGICGFVDVEHALDPAYARKIGVDVDNLYVSQPDTGEQALEITEALVRSGAMDVVVVDSVAALVPRAEIEGEMGDSHMGLQARLMSQALRKLAGAVKNSGTCLIFTNQLRQKIGVMFGNPETTTGGMALKFYASVRLDIRRIQSIKQGAEVVGNRTRVTVKKNKVAPPFRVAEFDIMYNEGISTSGDLVDLGVEHGVIDKRGSFYSYGDVRLGQGRENSKTFLDQEAVLSAEIAGKIRDALGMPINLEARGDTSLANDTDSVSDAGDDDFDGIVDMAA
ncbi:MAG: recombinase RecA [Caldilineaceae bacterium]|nr:recombinase RecA [Caldilineaceae bacterium]MBP8109974.1 recombinase RecA [Caldilineaceae bacterium]MBP8125447.1 recombinase RecA [Caldilineaceae bacterium]MBP9072430.1 recombinase RecA [Caldilineaceae bacterium]